MHEYQLDDAENKFNDKEESYRPYEQEPNRPRPMTSADYQSPESRKHGYKPGGIDFGMHGSFPSVENTRAISAKVYKGPEKLVSPNSRKMNEKQQSYGKFGGDVGTKNPSFGLQNNKLVQNPSADTLKIPKNIPQDKERLYEETLHLKQHVNVLREENLKLKTKINNLEKEASKFEKMIQEANTTYYKEVSPAKAAESHLTLTLKQNIKEVKNTLKKRDEELGEIKKSMKYTKVQELEVQLKAFQDEASRLRTVMDHVMSEKAQIVMSDDDKNRLQEEYFVQATQVKTLKRDNEEMATAIKILEEQNFEYEKKLSEQDKKYKREQNQHKKILQEKEKEIAKLKSESTGGAAAGGLGQHSVLKRPMTSATRDDALRQELDKKTIENNNLINQLAEKRNQVLNLERQLRDLKSEFNEKVTSAQNEKQALLRELEKQKNAKASGPVDLAKGQGGNELKVQELKLDDYVRRASLQRNFSEEEKDKLLFNASAKTASQNERKEQKGAPKKRVQKVRPDDVKTLGYELNLRLRLKKLTFEDIDRMIWPEKVRKTGIITIKDMIEILKGEPFHLAKEEDYVLCARFLIEENEHEYLYYDENVKNELQIVRSILKKMIGNLPPWDETNVRRMHEEITDVCVENYGGLRENLKALCKSGFLTAKDLKEACNLIEVSLTDEQIEYAIMKLFESSNDISKLAIDKFFEIFSKKYLEEEFSKNRYQQQDEEDEPEEHKSHSMNQNPASKHSIREAQREEDEEDEEDASPVKGQSQAKGRFEDEDSQEEEGNKNRKERESQDEEEEEEEDEGKDVEYQDESDQEDDNKE